MLAEHPDLPAVNDVITLREDLASGQTVGARCSLVLTAREKQREREKEGAQERDNKNSESGAQKLRKILFFPLSLVPCTPEIPHIFQIPKAFTM